MRHLQIIFVSLCYTVCLKASYIYEKPIVEFNIEEISKRQDNVTQGLATESSDIKSFAQDYMDFGVNLKKNSPQCNQNKCFCGTPQSNRIVGGTRVRQNKYPWTAQLVKGRWYPRLFCGGALINDRYVLTAAHCVHGNKEQITVRLLQLDRSTSGGITRKVKTVIEHPKYDQTVIANDIALLKLESPVRFSMTLFPVCLPSLNQNFDGLEGTIAGWGVVKEGGSTANYLNEVTVPIITNEECRMTRYKNKITENMLCAGLVQTGGKDACQGDSGGALIVRDGRYKIAGVVSFGFGCAQVNAPGVYTRVTKYLNWIRTNTRDGCYCEA